MDNKDPSPSAILLVRLMVSGLWGVSAASEINLLSPVAILSVKMCERKRTLSTGYSLSKRNVSIRCHSHCKLEEKLFDFYFSWKRHTFIKLKKIFFFIDLFIIEYFDENFYKKILKINEIVWKVILINIDY